MKPAKGKKLTLEATLEGEPVQGDAAFKFTWMEDLGERLHAADQQSALDDRRFTIQSCREWNDLNTKIDGNKAKVEIESTVPHDAWGGNRNALEIYACMRAEYKYIEDKKYTKVSSRLGSNGIDHIFVQGDNYVIVESKTISDLSKIANLKTQREPDTIISVLGKGRQEGELDDGILYATQMSIRWLRSCLNDLAAKKNTTAEQIIADWEKGNPPKRVVNIYGGIDWNADGLYDELEGEAKRQYDEAVREYDGAAANLERANLNLKRAETLTQKEQALQEKATAEVNFRNASQAYAILPKLRETSVDGKPYVGSKTKKGGKPTGKREFLFIHKEWGTANPYKGIFYLLPGKYDIKVRAAHLNRPESIEGSRQVDFADKRFRDEEFFGLDTLPHSTLAKLEELTKVGRKVAQEQGGKAQRGKYNK